MNISKSLFLRLILFTLSVLFLFIFSACLDSSSQNSSGINNVASGTIGISARFLENTPPDKIYISDDGAGSETQVMFEIKNEGTHTIEDDFIRFSLSGFDQNIITLTDSSPSIGQLEGKSTYVKDGGFDILEMGRFFVNPLKMGREYSPTILLNIFYKYKTIATSSICIDKKAYDPNIKNRVCTVGDITLSGGQGAPIAVTKVEEVSTPSKVILRIYFSNVGGGTLFYDENLDYVKDNGISQKSLDKIKIDKVSVGGTEFDCVSSLDNENLIRVQNVLTCSSEQIDTPDAYLSVLKIEASYGYLTSISKKINIVNLVNYN